MTDRMTTRATCSDGSNDVFGHPRGLAVLFATETWERFSYFGNAALVVLYMVKYLFDPARVETVIGFAAVKAALESVFGQLEAQPLASQLFGFYTGLAYFMPIAGGIVADRWLGQRRTVIIGGVLMAIGHFMMAFEALFLFALTALILGIGAFKPNISTQVGALYAPGDSRRDRAYSIFYVGINIGALLAPLVCGTLAAQYGWHYGFAAAGVGMLVSLAIYLGGQRALPPDPLPHAKVLDKVLDSGERPPQPYGPAERRAVFALVGISALVTLFWAAYDQQGNTVLLWAEDFTERSVDLGLWRGDIPSPWFLTLNPLMIFLLTPLIVLRWARQGERGTEPPAASKMAFGCLCVALANLVLAAAAWSNVGAGAGKASPLWLVGYFVLATIGELHLAPVGLALISKLAPARALSLMMGIWFAATLPADILGGFLGGFWSRMPKADFFVMIGAIAAFASVAIWAFQKSVISASKISASTDRGA
jgi:proton-dependent oligopeptide transporter, POT family